jgi:hypothetical protein
MKYKTSLLQNTLIFSFFILCLSGCKHDDIIAPLTPSGTVIFSIDHQVNGQPLKENELVYTNAAGNEYLITEVKYFISDITFYHHDGSRKVIGDWKDIFYIDEDIPETKSIRFPDKIPTGTYDSITFIFGITEEKNKSFMYVDPPEVLMGWPQILGGGYHYMMMNGKWKDVNGLIMPFNFHLGIGQLYKGNDYNVDSIYAFIQNYFKVSLPGSSFTMTDKDTMTFRLTMNIENWFENPHVFDFDQWGGAIMQNQPAMNMAKENGWNVFSIQNFFLLSLPSKSVTHAP